MKIFISIKEETKKILENKVNAKVFKGRKIPSNINSLPILNIFVKSFDAEMHDSMAIEYKIEPELIIEISVAGDDSDDEIDEIADIVIENMLVDETLNRTVGLITLSGMKKQWDYKSDTLITIAVIRFNLEFSYEKPDQEGLPDFDPQINFKEEL